jgi:hypothetical protein
MARTYRANEAPTRTDRPARADLLQRIQQREQAWEQRAEVLPILRR